MNKQSWTIGIFCYNEAGTIQKEMEKVWHVLNNIASEFEILVVDDGSTDGSRELIEKTATDITNVQPIFFSKNKGIGASLNAIYKQARFENVLASPGDGQFDINEILPFANVSTNHFVSFYRKENTIYNGYRNLLSLINKKLNKVLLGITIKDVNWVQAFKLEHLKQLDLQLKSSLVESEISAKLLYLGVQNIESESKYLPRIYGNSKGSSLKTVSKAIRDIFILIKVMNQFKKKHKRNSLRTINNHE